jgi:hypothetical protein
MDSQQNTPPMMMDFDLEEMVRTRFKTSSIVINSIAKRIFFRIGYQRRICFRQLPATTIDG